LHVGFRRFYVGFTSVLCRFHVGFMSVFHQELATKFLHASTHPLQVKDLTIARRVGLAPRSTYLVAQRPLEKKLELCAGVNVRIGGNCRSSHIDLKRAINEIRPPAR